MEGPINPKAAYGTRRLQPSNNTLLTLAWIQTFGLHKYRGSTSTNHGKKRVL